MTDFLEVSGPASLAALLSTLVPDQPRPLGSIASFWLDGDAVFAVAQFDTAAAGDWPFLISVQPTSVGSDVDVRRESRRMSHRLRTSGWTVRNARFADRAVA